MKSITSGRIAKAKKQSWDSQYFYRGYSPEWHEIPFGKYKGLSMPALFFQDLGYFRWLIVNDILQEENDFQKALLREAKDVARRAQHIRVPKLYRDDDQFAIIRDRDGAFGEFCLTDKNTPRFNLRKGWSVASVDPILDVTVVFNFKNRALSIKRMTNCLIHMFLARNASEENCEAFFSKLKNFNDATAALENLGIYL